MCFADFAQKYSLVFHKPVMHSNNWCLFTLVKPNFVLTKHHIKLMKQVCVTCIHLASFHFSNINLSQPYHTLFVCLSLSQSSTQCELLLVELHFQKQADNSSVCLVEDCFRHTKLCWVDPVEKETHRFKNTCSQTLCELKTK